MSDGLDHLHGEGFKPPDEQDVVVETLLHALGDPVPAVRCSAVRGLSRQPGDKSAVCPTR